MMYSGFEPEDDIWSYSNYQTLIWISLSSVTILKPQIQLEVVHLLAYPYWGRTTYLTLV